MSVANNACCLICNGSCLSSRNSIQIFSSETVLSSEKHISTLLSNVLETEISEENVHSKVICKKCFKNFVELDDLESRCLEIKNEVLQSYNFTLNKLNNDSEENPTDEKVELAEERKPKKMLDIPSSDDDGGMKTTTFQEEEAAEAEDIEMQLVRMHGGMENENFILGDNETVNDREDIDAGALDQSSDSDYDPNDNADLLKAAALAEKNNPDNVEFKDIKQEPSDGEKPNILKRKTVQINDPKSESTEKPLKEEYEFPIVSRDGNIYTCLLCEGDETVAGEPKAIIPHMKEAHEVRLYICDVCGDDFRKRTELSAHMDDHVATEEGDFQCEVCNRIFSNLRLFRIHRRMHFPQNKAWPCSLCGKKYSSKNLLDEHMNTHTGVRPYVCQNCGKDFASKYTFRAHEKTHEVRPRPFQCTQCNKSFLSQQNLNQHEKTHLGIKEYQCHLCNKQFGSLHNLEVHSIVHTGFKPYSCKLCGKMFARKAEIRDHERTHTGERPYQCEFCGATFSQRSNLQSHKRATHYDDKRHKCDECGKAFKRRRLLEYHLKAAHTGERPFKCNLCEATFVYPEHFKKHRRIHTGEKPFLCEVCGKAFNSRDNRNAHRFVHSDKKPYECLVCGAGFMRKPLLYQHMQSQGHLNDTIVVNQPRLTTDDDQMVTVNADGDMEIVEQSGMAVGEDSKLYIADLADGEVLHEEEEGSGAVEHIIIDGQQISFAEEMEDEEGNEIGEEEYEEIITGDVLADGETQIIDTPEGPVQLVKVRIPNESGEEQEAWVKIVPE